MSESSGEFEFPESEVVASHHLQIAALGSVRLSYLVSAEDASRTVVVISVGSASAVPLVRIQSRCLFGEVFHSPECDCDDQLWTSLAEMQSEGSGMLIYLDQEGRGAGIRAKASAYEWAEKCQLDPFNPNGRMRLVRDTRSYVDAVRVLQLVTVDRCVLLTNNPAKIKALEDAGIAVDRKPLWVPSALANDRFVRTMQRAGHLT